MIKKRINNGEDSFKKDESSFNNRKEFKTYKDEAIEVLNILEQSGINIYDENNYGGMYLKRKASENIPKPLEKLFQETKNIPKNEEDINLNNLIQFFNNNSKNVK